MRRAAKYAATAVVAVLAWLFVWPALLGGSMTYVVISGPSMEPAYAVRRLRGRSRAGQL